MTQQKTLSPGGVPVFDLTGTSITTEEEIDIDVYQGPKEELIAAGIVTEAMWPKGEKRHISWSQGKQIIGNCRKDLTYRRINLYWDQPRVAVGLDPEVRKKRHQRHQREQEARKLAELKKEADAARRDLKEMLASENEYRRYLAQFARQKINWLVQKLALEASNWHGYKIDPDSAEDILMSADAVVDAIMRAEVKFDQELHKTIAQGYEKKIRAADPAFYIHLDKLMAIDPSILQGEAG